jgi:hypothetical protein
MFELDYMREIVTELKKRSEGLQSRHDSVDLLLIDLKKGLDELKVEERVVELEAKKKELEERRTELRALKLEYETRFKLEKEDADYDDDDHDHDYHDDVTDLPAEGFSSDND